MPNRQAAMGTWWDGYSGQSTVIIDEFYCWLGLDFVLRLLDRYPFAVETKGGSVQFTSKRVVFTSNAPSTEWYATVRHRDSLFRRLGGAIYEFPGQDQVARFYLQALIAAQDAPVTDVFSQ